MNKPKKIILPVYGMKCEKCVAKVRKTLQTIKTISEINISLPEKRATFFSTQKNIDELLKEAEKKLIEKGFSITPLKKEPEKNEKKKKQMKQGMNQLS